MDIYKVLTVLQKHDEVTGGMVESLFINKRYRNHSAVIAHCKEKGTRIWNPELDEKAEKASKK
jgi:hypothetical protein